MARFLLIAFNFRCGHQPMGFLVFHHVDIVFLATLHALFLFAEGAEQVFHQSPMQEGPIFIGPSTLHPRKLPHFCYRMLCGGDGTFVLIQIDKYLYFITDTHIFRYIPIGQKDVAFIAAVQIQTVICTFLDSQYMIIS